MVLVKMKETVGAMAAGTVQDVPMDLARSFVNDDRADYSNEKELKAQRPKAGKRETANGKPDKMDTASK
jgi:hypothetical protein